MGQIKIIDHLCPAEAETRAELGNNGQSAVTSCKNVTALASEKVTPREAIRSVCVSSY